MKQQPQQLHQQKLDIVQIGKMMYDRRFIVAGDGNISIRIDDNTLLAPPRQMSLEKALCVKVCLLPTKS